MTEKQFMQFFNQYLNETILPTMIGKGLGQYSNQEDRFHNFNQLSELKGEKKEKCLTDLVAKQIVCLYDYIKNWNKEGIVPTPVWFNTMDELIKDIIIYMFLLRGMFYEHQQTPTDTITDWATDSTDISPKDYCRRDMYNQNSR